ncbi:hypothetical protein LA345_12815 [Burkholderia vietnamiensis]|uniref:Uncharacterized protein n=1 Tax=Burkholderia vietnamiensis (strain G4 / LMG 22486) TaxID=269482 RepID=A4JFI1_BURVG|nr:hypothetical protein Bcep1808_2032 [Burkholderia vietnamiensis G4]MCB4344793.1 hypothetical protein [Burkholderia vietnamiensis]
MNNATSIKVGSTPRLPRVRPLASLALVSLLALSVGVAHAQQASDAAQQAPRFAVGDSWTYVWHDDLTGKEQQLDEAVKAVNPDGSINVAINGAEAVLSADGNVVKSASGSYSPAEVKLRFPLRAGDSYSAQYDYHDSTGRNWTRQMTAKVEGVETVQTKAGSFDAVRVKISGGWYSDGQPGGGGSFNETMWYAPQTKRFVKDVFQSIPRGRGVGNTTQTELTAYVAKP